MKLNEARINIGEIIKKQNGITLISLVITIVILIILAGVAINLSIGENGIFSKAKEARRQYEIADVREKIEIAMLDIESDQIVKNEECTVDTMVEELPNKINGITIEKEGNIAKGTYNGYNFTINENLKLYIEGESLAVTARTEIKEYIGKDSNDKYAVKVILTLEAEKAIAEVEIENTDGTTTKETVGNNTYSKELEIELDKEYKINITADNGAKTSKKVSVSSTNEINNVEQFVAFRDSVNSGLTYEGATINLKSDIDLSSVCYRVDGTTENDVSWEPIGNRTTPFKGTFDGNYKTIKNLYINTTKDFQGLFGFIEVSKIEGIVIDKNSKISANNVVGGIIGDSLDSDIIECGNNAQILVVHGNVGGIAGMARNTDITSCYNKGNIEGIKTTGGGIVGWAEKNTVKYSYNYGNIIGDCLVGGIARSFWR